MGKRRAFGTTDSNEVDMVSLSCVCVLFDDVQTNAVSRADDEHDFSPFLLVVGWFLLLTLFVQIGVTGEEED